MSAAEVRVALVGCGRISRNHFEAIERTGVLVAETEEDLRTRVADLLRVLWLTPAMDRLWTEAPEGRRRFLDRMTMSFEPAHAEAVLAYAATFTRPGRASARVSRLRGRCCAQRRGHAGRALRRHHQPSADRGPPMNVREAIERPGIMSVAGGVAVLRYGLYEIDVVISKAVVFGVLLVLVGLVYVSLWAGRKLFPGDPTVPTR